MLGLTSAAMARYVSNSCFKPSKTVILSKKGKALSVSIAEASGFISSTLCGKKSRAALNAATVPLSSSVNFWK